MNVLFKIFYVFALPHDTNGIALAEEIVRVEVYICMAIVFDCNDVYPVAMTDVHILD